MEDSSRPAITLDEASAVIAGSPFGPWWGFEVRDLSRGYATVDLPARPHHFRPGGVLQGGCCMTLADVTFWLAIMTIAGSAETAVTLEMKTSFLRAATGDLRCSGRVIMAGRRIAYGDASTFGPGETLVAHHTLTYLRPAQER